jgi:hypothetical protein
MMPIKHPARSPINERARQHVASVAHRELEPVGDLKRFELQADATIQGMPVPKGTIVTFLDDDLFGMILRGGPAAVGEYTFPAETSLLFNDLGAGRVLTSATLYSDGTFGSAQLGKGDAILFLRGKIARITTKGPRAVSGQTYEAGALDLSPSGEVTKFTSQAELDQLEAEDRASRSIAQRVSRDADDARRKEERRRHPACNKACTGLKTYEQCMKDCKRR